MKRLPSRDGAAGFGDQHAQAGMAAREHEPLDGFEEQVVVVDLRFEVGGVDRERAVGARRDLRDGGTVFLKIRQDAARVPVEGPACVSIPLPDRPAHALVRYSDLVELRTIGPETQSLVEAGGRHLRVQVDLGEAPLDGEIHEATHDRDAGAGAAKTRQYCDATNLTGGFQAPCANRVTFCLGPCSQKRARA
jgi:hypothetical protein